MSYVVLPPCSGKPNCVSTDESRQEFAIAPIQYATTVEEMKIKIKTVASKLGKNRLIGEGSDFLVFEFISSIFHFVDDVEFRFDEDAKLIHFRSASRMGYSDLGVNRKRMESFRKQLLQSSF